MRRIFVLPILFLAYATVQAQRPELSQTVVLKPPASSQACPIDGIASRKTNGEVEVTGGNGAGANAFGVHLVLTPGVNMKAPEKIASASVTVHALSAKQRLLPAGSGAEPDVQKDFHLTSSARDASSISADLWLERRATVQWVDVTEVRYADRSSWHAGAGASCRIVPQGLVLVAGTQ